MIYVLEKVDGSIAIMNVLQGTPQQSIAQWPIEAQNAIVAVHEATGIEFPTDRTFRNGWKWNGKIDYDMPKCRDIHRQHLRQARAPKLATLDVEYQRADEEGDTTRKQDIAATKHLLRDVTVLPEIDAAQTPEDLLKIWPDYLK